MFSAGARTKVTVTCSPGSGRGPSQKLGPPKSLKELLEQAKLSPAAMSSEQLHRKVIEQGVLTPPCPPCHPLPKNSTIATLREELRGGECWFPKK